MKRFDPHWVAVLGLCLTLSVPAADLPAQTSVLQVRVEEAVQLRAQLGLGRFEFHPPEGLSQIKIAILDRGFTGLRSEDLPPNARLETFAEQSGVGLDRTAHGAALARIVWAVTGGRADGPQIFLLNANGLTRFRQAIDFVIREKIGIVLHAQNWEYGGNFDGKGFIDAEVSRATRAGILWVAAAGGYGGKVREGTLRPGFEESECLWFENRLDRNAVTATLAWNDFQDTEAYATSKDLALILASSDGSERIAVADRKQEGRIPGVDEQQHVSAHAREILEKELPRGRYCLRVRARSGIWSTHDRFRITLGASRADGVDWVLSAPGRDHSPGEIMVPADHPEVVTVGDRSPYSAHGPTRDGRVKPEVILDSSEIRFTDGTLSAGTSNAAALVAGWAALQLASAGFFDGMSRQSFLDLVSRQRPDWLIPMPKAPTTNDLHAVPRSELAPLLNAILVGCELRPEQVLSANRIQGRVTIWISQGQSQIPPRCFGPLDPSATLQPRTFLRILPSLQWKHSVAVGSVAFEDERWGQPAWTELKLLP